MQHGAHGAIPQDWAAGKAINKWVCHSPSWQKPIQESCANCHVRASIKVSDYSMTARAAAIATRGK
jgi:hypothetical protein